MAMVSVIATVVDVACDLFTGRPRSVRMGGDHVPVISIERIREESAAYPMDQGPRTTFVVRTSENRLRLTFRHRDRSWIVDGLDPDPEALANAA
jgi:hypothetical protein